MIPHNTVFIIADIILCDQTELFKWYSLHTDSELW